MRFQRKYGTKMRTQCPVIIEVFASVLKRPRTPRFSSRKTPCIYGEKSGGKEGLFETASFCASSIELWRNRFRFQRFWGSQGPQLMSNTDCGNRWCEGQEIGLLC